MRDDGACDELREESDKAGVVEQRAVPDLTVEGVDDERDLLKCEKAYAEREHDVLERPVGAEYGVYRFHEKVVIFEIKKHAEIDGHGENPGPAAGLIACQHGGKTVKPVVYKDAGNDQYEIHGRIRAVEPQRHAKKKYERRRFQTEAVEQKIARQTQRQKTQQKYI